LPRLLVVNAAEAAISNSGRRTGVYVDIGHSSTRIVPVIHLYAAADWAVTLPVGGRAISEALVRMVRDGRAASAEVHDYAVKASSHASCVNRALDHRLKDALVSVRLSSVSTAPKTASFKIADGHVLTLDGADRERLGEALFTPQHSEKRLPEAIADCINDCYPEAKPDLWANIVLCGGGSMVTGLRERLQAELQRLVPADATGNVQVKHLGSARYASWVGASMLAMQSSVPWITREDYDRHGANIVNRRAVSLSDL